MPTPCESWPLRLARTRCSAVSCANRVLGASEREDARYEGAERFGVNEHGGSSEKAASIVAAVWPEVRFAPTRWRCLSSYHAVGSVRSEKRPAMDERCRAKFAAGGLLRLPRAFCPRKRSVVPATPCCAPCRVPTPALASGATALGSSIRRQPMPRSTPAPSSSRARIVRERLPTSSRRRCGVASSACWTDERCERCLLRPRSCSRCRTRPLGRFPPTIWHLDMPRLPTPGHRRRPGVRVSRCRGTRARAARWS